MQEQKKDETVNKMKFWGFRVFWDGLRRWGALKSLSFFLSVDPAMVGWWGGERSDFDSKNPHFLSSSIFFIQFFFFLLLRMLSEQQKLPRERI